MGRGMITRGKIERSSLELFVEKGIAATTTREISSQAGISEGAIYRHFASKDEIAFELFKSIHIRLADMIEAIAVSQDKFEDKVRAIVTTYVNLADEDPLLFAYHLRFQHLFFHRFAERKRPNPVDNVEKIIAEAIDEGVIPSGDAILLGAMALGIVMQPSVHRTYGRLDHSLSDHIDQFTNCVLAVLRQPG
jgi:AcrR family transcriptional regulator